MIPGQNYRTVLIVAYYFPPLGLSGVQRTAKFAKYLSRYGWKPTVLTVDPGGYYAFDESLLKEVEEAGVTVVRSGSLDVNRLFRKKGVVRLPSETVRRILGFFGDLFFIPDTKIGWKKKAVTAGTVLLRNREFDAIIATAPPQTDFLIGVELARVAGIPLLLDYRDAWIGYPFKYFPGPLHRWLHKRMERRIVAAADKIVVTHRRIKEELLTRHQQFGYRDISILSQGYDEEDFRGLRPRREKDFLTIVHTGTFYGKRSPEILLKAVSLLTFRRPELRRTLRIRFIGAMRKQDIHAARRWEVADIVSFEGYVEHKESVRAVVDADVLWYINDNDLSAPGKLYEYFASGNTILASVVSGYTRQLLVDSRGAVCVPIDDLPGLIRALEDLVEKKQQGSLPRTPHQFAAQFERMKLTGELARHLEHLMEYDRGEIVKLREREL